MNKKDVSRTVLIISILLALAGGMIGGYTLGTNAAESDLEQQKDAASSKVEQGQAAVSEGQQTIESLQSDNAQLESTIDEQAQKITDLEAQLAEESTDTTTPATE